MKTIQMTIDEPLLESIDLVVVELGTSRSAFIRDAVQKALNQLQIRRLEAQHIAGYREHPLTSEEIDEWADIRVWGDE